MFSLRSRRLEVAGERENGRARGRHARGEGEHGQSFKRRKRFFFSLLLVVFLYTVNRPDKNELIQFF